LEFPAPKRKIEQWLAELSVISAKRADDAASEALRVEAYAARLSRYPADVVKAALLDRPWKFWPTWAELERVCEELSSPRRAMMSALRAGPKREEERRGPTDEERARIAALIEERFPGIPQEWKDAAKQKFGCDADELSAMEVKVP